MKSIKKRSNFGKIKSLSKILFVLLSLYLFIFSPFGLGFNPLGFHSSLLVFAAPDKDYTAEQLWKAVDKKWDEINSYTCKIFAWNYKTQWFIDNFPEYKDKEKKPGEEKPDWAYRLYDIKFKKPEKTLLAYEISKNEKIEEGGLINRGVAYILRYIPGTTFNYGFKDKDYVYIKFPFVNLKEMANLPIPVTWKAPMTILLYASHSEVYWKTLDELKDLRGNYLSDLAIDKMMKKNSHYLKDSTNSVTMSPYFVMNDYTLSEDGWLNVKPAIETKKEKNIYKITMLPKDTKKSRGITKLEVFIDPELMMFVGLNEYENNKLVQVMSLMDLKLNAELPDNLWENFFKGRKVSNKKDN